jgi:hypothetical protein
MSFSTVLDSVDATTASHCSKFSNVITISESPGAFRAP